MTKFTTDIYIYIYSKSIITDEPLRLFLKRVSNGSQKPLIEEEEPLCAGCVRKADAVLRLA